MENDMSELDRLANELEAEQLSNEDLEEIIRMVRSRLAGYDAKSRAKTEEAETVNIFEVVKVPEPTIKLVRRKI
jgi:uncharacterized protein with von Willebrand factor type A (vWA) domain